MESKSEGSESQTMTQLTQEELDMTGKESKERKEMSGEEAMQN